MSWWSKRASNLQLAVRESEAAYSHVNIYEEDEIRRAIVHTRQDIILLASYLDSLNSQMRSVRWLLTGVLACLIVLMLR